MTTRTLSPEDKVYVHADLYDAGVTEDGSRYTADAYSIIVERLDGHRIVLNKVWFTAPGDESPDGFMFFGDLRKEMLAEAEAVVDRIERKGVIDMDHWVETTPRYGSDYFCEVNGF